MPGRQLQTEAFILLKRPPADSFQTFTLFSPEHGALLALQRLPKKNAANHLTLDLFDEVALLLETANQGSTWFVKEVRLLARPAGIGRSYESLLAASAFAALVARNPVHEESRPAVAALLRVAFASFAASPRADIVYFKSLYCFARDEGYPVKQGWFPALATADRAIAVALLNRPLGEQTALPADTARLVHRLEDYLRAHTEILLG